MSSNNRQTSRKYKVVIVGGGAAGIGAAHYLVKHGVHDVVILEASDRFGGRILTASFGSSAENIIELGANWIHGGTIANPFFTAALQKGFTEKDGRVPVLDRFRNCCFGKSDGKLVELELGQRAIAAFFKAERDAYLLFFRKTTAIEDEMNLEDYLKSALKQRLMEDFSVDEHDDVKRAFNAMWNYLKFHTSDDLCKLSAKNYGSFQEIPGNDVMVPGGFTKLLQAFVDDLPPDVLHCNRHVTRIDWSTNGSDQMSIHCKDGSVWRSDHVIVTVSLGYLKRHVDHLFHPQLPSFKRDAIDKIGFGSTNKIFVEFAKPFWRPGMLGCIAMAWSDEELTSGEDHWEKTVYGFDEVYNNPNVLVGWTAGSGSRQMELASDAEVAETCIKLIRRFTGNPNIPAPSRIWRTRWCSDQWALGSYSYMSNRSGLKEIGDLVRPLPCEKRPELMFAGEATHDNYYSTIHGALLTGIREAQRVISAQTSASNCSKL